MPGDRACGRGGNLEVVGRSVPDAGGPGGGARARRGSRGSQVSGVRLGGRGPGASEGPTRGVARCQIAPGGSMAFTHLHLHTLYSLLDGAIRMKDLIRTVKEKGMSSVAVTDHGNMFGAIDLYKASGRACMNRLETKHVVGVLCAGLLAACTGATGATGATGPQGPQGSSRQGGTALTSTVGPAVEKNIRRGRLHMRPLRRPAPGGGLRLQLRHLRPHPRPPPPPIPAASPGPRPGPTTTPAVRLTPRGHPAHPHAVQARGRAWRRLPSTPTSRVHQAPSALGDPAVGPFHAPTPWSPEGLDPKRSLKFPRPPHLRPSPTLATDVLLTAGVLWASWGIGPSGTALCPSLLVRPRRSAPLANGTSGCPGPNPRCGHRRLAVGAQGGR